MEETNLNKLIADAEKAIEYAEERGEAKGGG